MELLMNTEPLSSMYQHWAISPSLQTKEKAVSCAGASNSSTLSQQYHEVRLYNCKAEYKKLVE